MRYGLQVCAAPADRRGPRRALGIRAGFYKAMKIQALKRLLIKSYHLKLFNN